MGPALARIPGHRPRRADPRADRRLPGQGAARDAAGASSRTAPRRRSRRSSRRSWMPVCACPRSSTTARWPASAMPKRRRPMSVRPRMNCCGCAEICGDHEPGRRRAAGRRDRGDRPGRLRRPHAAGTVRGGRRAPQRLGMDAAGIAAAAQVCRWLLTSRLVFIEDRNALSDRRRSDRGADVRHRRTAFGHNADARADVGRPGRAGAAVLGGDVSVAAARPGRRRRSAPRAGRRGLARDQRQDAQVAAQPSLQRHARRRPARRRAHLGVRLPGDDAHRVVAGADAVAGRRPGHRRHGAVPAAQGDAAAAAIPPAAKVLGAEGFSRLPAAGDVRGLSGRDAGLAAPRPGAGRRVAHDDDGRHRRRHRRAGRPARRWPRCTSS